MKSLPFNSGGHLYDGSKYAHFSQITDTNKHRFPLFEKASPISFRIEKGECLVIPKGWWHHVKSYGSRCLSVNFWYDNGSDVSSLSDVPIKIQDAISGWKALEKWSDDYLINKIDSILVEGVWLVLDNFACKKRISVSDFVKTFRDSTKYAYLITPTDFEHVLGREHNNIRILEILEGDFEIPFPDHMKNANANFWMNFGGIDTGLHYDDEDGLLCVVEGYKEVLLYPPSDSQFLYPYPLKPIKLQQSHHLFHYNLYKRGPLLDTKVTNSDLLEVCLHKAPNVANVAQKLQDKYGPGKMIYGVKCKDGIVRYEFYFYGIHSVFDREVLSEDFYSDEDHNSQWELNEYIKFHETLFPEDHYDLSKVDKTGLCIFSIDLTEEDVILGRTPNLNLYYSTSPVINIPFLLYERTYYQNSSQKLRGVVWTDEYRVIFSSANTFATKCDMIGINIEDAKNVINFAIKTQYACSVVSIFNKGPEIGLYFYGIKIDPFISFLDTYNYPGQLTEFCLQHREDLAKTNIEVGFHFLKGSQTSTPSRSAFYGVF